MPFIYGFTVRSSGRDLTAVRRPRRMAAGRPVVVAPVEAVPDYGDMLKADVVELAESRGIDASGTKADIVARLSHG